MKYNVEVDTRLSLSDYFNVVDDLVLSYFDVDGKYQPQMGFINSIKVFYNYCVKHSSLDGIVEHDFSNLVDVEIIMEHDEIMREYFKATTLDYEPSYVDFARAYQDALDIVEHKKTSVGNLAEQLGTALEKIVARINEVVNREDLDKMAEISKYFAEHGVDADAIMKAYGKSEKFNGDLVNLEDRRKQKQEEQKE